MDLNTFVLLLVGLACPVGMGLMVWMMNKNMNQSADNLRKNDELPSDLEDYLAQLRLQRGLLDAEIAELETQDTEQQKAVLQSLWERYRDQGVVLVGVTYLDLERDSRKFIQEFGVTYRTGQTWVQEFRETTAFREFQRRLGLTKTEILCQRLLRQYTRGSLIAFWTACYRPDFCWLLTTKKYSDEE